MDLFLELNQNGITVVIVTHELEVALYAKRVLRFRDGAIIDDEVISRSQLERKTA